MSRADHPLLNMEHTARRVMVSAGAPWEALADSLAGDLEAVLMHPVRLPSGKARLTRIGGRCPVHGVLLEFDPWQPTAHRCDRCDVIYRGREHDDWWMMGAHLWTIERAVHAAALYVLRGDRRHAMFASAVLRQYADRYRHYPNRDNVLGPSRLFFSTYLESIWLLNACHALALLEYAAAFVPSTPLTATSAHQLDLPVWSHGDAQRIRESVIEPASHLIGGFHEGRSNRQIWNEVAVCSAWRMLGHDHRVRDRLADKQGLSGLIAQGLDTDGFWYEGENYHLFAHRGMWYGVELMRAMQQPLDVNADAKYRAGFLAPLLGILPDETFPSRRDSQYASSIRQWRTAEWCELGWAYTSDARLAAVLRTLYDSPYARGDTGRARSTADSERNLPPTGLTRADLSWRALLMGAPHLAQDPSQIEDQALTSVCLPSQGLAILRRRRGQIYVSLDGGETGGGHGHPDQLALTLQTGHDRWLEDPGTGSYVEPRLFWYRSTLAHAAPFVDGVSQRQAVATLEAFEDAETFGWMVKRVDGVASGVALERTVVVGEHYLVDVLSWTSDRRHEIALPIAGVAELAMPAWIPLPVASSAPPMPASLDDPFAFATRRETMALRGTVALRAWPSHAPHVLRHAVSDLTDADRVAASVWYSSSAPATLHRAIVPATPGQGETQRHWLTTEAASGSLVGVWSWPVGADRRPIVRDVQLVPSTDATLVAAVLLRDGGEERHSPTAQGWQVTRQHGATVSTVGLARIDRAGEDSRGIREPHRRDISRHSHAAAADVMSNIDVPRVLSADADSAPGHSIPGAVHVELGESHYVGTEESWSEAEAPTATVQIAVTDAQLLVDLRVRTGPIVVNASADNLLDNEPGDVNADGVQWYVRMPEPLRTGNTDHSDVPATASWQFAGLVVPHQHPARQTALSATVLNPHAEWREIDGGWAMRLGWALEQLPVSDSDELAFELVVNERPPSRERRRGQLVLSGGGGFGYLAGARRAAGQFVRLILPARPPKRRFDDAPGLS